MSLGSLKCRWCWYGAVSRWSVRAPGFPGSLWSRGAGLCPWVPGAARVACGARCLGAGRRCRVPTRNVSIEAAVDGTVVLYKM